jgi:hypothetical protein
VKKRDVNRALNVMLPLLLLVSFATGWTASLLGLTEFGIHKYSSIAVFVVALGHLVLHWRGFVAQVRRRESVARNPRRLAVLRIGPELDRVA